MLFKALINAILVRIFCKFYFIDASYTFSEKCNSVFYKYASLKNKFFI